MIAVYSFRTQTVNVRRVFIIVYILVCVVTDIYEFLFSFKNVAIDFFSFIPLKTFEFYSAHDTLSTV